MTINSFNNRGFAGAIIKRVFDVSVALITLAVTLPFLLVVAMGIVMSSPGPIFYKARRVGKRGKVFSMLKFRTMHVDSDRSSIITSPVDNRIFGYGLWLRRLKIDEILQFWNILIGDMSLVGPRPEDPKIVEQDYKNWMQETLHVLPGVTGPGSVYGYIYGDALLDLSDPEGSYVRNLLPPKLALERAYMERAGLITDFSYILLTLHAIVLSIFGCDVCLPRVDIEAARRWAPNGPYPSSKT